MWLSLLTRCLVVLGVANMTALGSVVDMWLSLLTRCLSLLGMANMTALGSVVSWQKLDYDFEFHQQPFHTDIGVLVLSEGKSLLKVCLAICVQLCVIYLISSANGRGYVYTCVRLSVCWAVLFKKLRTGFVEIFWRVRLEFGAVRIVILVQ